MADREDFQKYMDDQMTLWQEISEMVRPFIKEKLVVTDVGASIGCSLLAFHQAGMLEKGFLVEPRFDKLQDSFLNSKNMDLDYYQKRNIHVLALDGLDSQVPYHLSGLVIKTFNGWTPWADIFPKLSPGCLLLTSSRPDHFLSENHQGKQVAQYIQSFDSGGENVYDLYKF